MKRKDNTKDFTWQFYKGNRGLFLAVLFFVILSSFDNLGVSWILQQIIDSMTGESGVSLITLLVITVSAVGYIAVSGAIMGKIKPRFITKAMKQYKDHAFATICNKGIAAFRNEDSSLYISAFSNDAATIEKNYVNSTFEIISQLIMFVGSFVMMMFYSPLLTLISFGFSLFPVIASLITGSRLESAEKAVSEKQAGFVSTIKDALSGFSVIKSFKAESRIIRQISDSNGDVESKKYNRDHINYVISVIGAAAGVIAQFGVFLTGAFMAQGGYDITAGKLMVFVNLMNFVIGPIATVPGLLANRKAAKALIKKLADAAVNNEDEGGVEIDPVLEKGISVSDVSFEYEDGKMVLKNLSVDFAAGSSTAIVGGSGCGKSTLLNLLMAGERDYRGSISFDGMELSTISTKSLYDLESIIQQNVFIFNSSIRDNITMFGDYSEDKVEEAILRSGLDKLIAERGKDYLCGENGSGLSGGEKQRIAIARSLLKGTPVLLVDEATAALDMETAAYVSNAILDIDGLTRIVVTHTLDEATLRRYDKIVALKNGNVCEEGTFDELIEKDGYFKSLYMVA